MSGKRRKPGPGASAAGFPWSGLAEKHGGKILTGVLALYAVLSLLLFDPKPFVGGDNAAYAALSESLVQGKGLTEIWSPEQRPHTQYPFGFPLMLAPFALLKLPYAWYKLAPWLAGLAGILLSWLLLKKHGALTALAACLFLAMNPHYLEFGHWVLSELPFLALMLLSLWLLARWEETGWWPWFLAAVLAAAASIHVRSAGMALLAAIPLHLVLRGKIRWAAIFLAGGAALMVPWALRNAHYGTSGGYLEQFLMLDPYQPGLGRAGLGELVSRVGLNLKLYLTSVWPQLVFPSMSGRGPGGAWFLWLVLLTGPVFLGAVSGVRHGWAGGWLLLGYLALSVLWPVAWTDRRFALPLLPFLLFFLFHGYRALLSIAFRQAWRYAAAVVLALLAIANIVPVLAQLGPNMKMQSEYRRGDRLAGYDPQWRSFFQAAGWVKSNTPGDAIVVSRKPQLFHLASGRSSYCYPFTVDQDSVHRALKNADYVMVEPVSGTAQRYLIPAVQPQIDRLYRVVHAAGNPPTYVLQVIKEGTHGE
ncbi:MAG TPA: hypothetical protein DDW31_03385 [candidate division Zixibacteria bacterium]|nr:hypothetical protein [candidate division Zixibacteria bacterium]